jgi:hypothetical protein
VGLCADGDTLGAVLDGTCKKKRDCRAGVSSMSDYSYHE